ncbi:MAG: UbiD family decarboxylase [Gemmataceae bacterium]|nr:UbiD family decarboxylase [Gemmataceae bacterium]
MGYASLRLCIADLERSGRLVRIDAELDPYLEVAAVHRRVYQAGGPALLFTRARGCRWPLVSNMFGTLDRARFLFRDTLHAVERLVDLKVDPGRFFREPWKYRGVPRTLWHARPKYVRSSPLVPVSLRDLPPVVCWPRDGGPFVTLPQVYTEEPGRPGWRHANLGMYRVQIAGNQFDPDHEVGLHYQIHRGIGVHHAKAKARGESLRVAVAVGGPRALAVAAVMPLPEGLPELAFAGALGGRRVRLMKGGPVFADADFVITGTIAEGLKPEGPFGDHLGYYSLTHDFPVLRVDGVFARPDAVWPFTVVGRPPQEDTSFGDLIHELTGPVLPTVVAGLHEVNAVDAAGVHPLLLATGSERYVPYAAERKPMELLTIANALLGQGQLSLAKYLVIVAKEDNPPGVRDIGAFFRHVLERVDWSRDLHFQTCTTIDTLDYSGTAINEGSKVVIAAAGMPRRTLATSLPAGLSLPDARVCAPGILAVRGTGDAGAFAAQLPALDGFPLVLLVDDPDFCSQALNNWLWVTFTRSDPATDIHGGGAFVRDKHWGCTGPLVIDARIKPRHAPPVEPDPTVEKRVDELGKPGGPLHGIV